MTLMSFKIICWAYNVVVFFLVKAQLNKLAAMKAIYGKTT